MPLTPPALPAPALPAPVLPAPALPKVALPLPAPALPLPEAALLLLLLVAVVCPPLLTDAALPLARPDAVLVAVADASKLSTAGAEAPTGPALKLGLQPKM